MVELLHVACRQLRRTGDLRDDTLAGLQDDVPHLLEAIGQSKELLAKARSTVNEYGTALSKNATDGALQLSSAAAQAQRALGTVSGDVAAAEAATNTALATAAGLLADNKTLVSDLTAQAGAAGACLLYTSLFTIGTTIYCVLQFQGRITIVLAKVCGCSRTRCVFRHKKRTELISMCGR